MSEIQLLNCDWLQFHGKHLGLAAGCADNGTNYIIKNVGHGTRVFRDVVQVYEKSSVTKSHRNELIATIACNPHSAILDANMFVCKIENKVLYQDNALLRVSQMIKQLRLQYEGITRCDLCVDLVRFANGWHPLYLLKKYRKNHVVKHGSRRYSQWLTAPFTPSDLNGIIDHDVLSGEHITHCVSWGGPNSDVHVKMYNKTKEIRESSDKRYISAYWRANGLVTTEDVWRVEISFQRRSRYLFDNSCGEVVPVNLELVLRPTFQREVFAALCKRHFRFKEMEIGMPARSVKDLELFNIQDCEVMQTAAPETKPIAGRTAKVCANFIEEVLRTTDFDSLLKKPDYDKFVLEAAHKTLHDLYEGLRVLDINKDGRERPTKRELQEKRDWLAQWNILPSEIDGVKWSKIDDVMTDYECRFLLMEELRLRQAELRAALQSVAVSECL